MAGASLVSYGQVVFDASKPLETRIYREPIWSPDQRNIYAWHWIIELTTYWNPAVNSYFYRNQQHAKDLLTNVDPIPQFLFQNPRDVDTATTDATLRTYLMVPRRTLIYQKNGVVLLRTPAPDYTCDINGGPVCTACDVIQWHGDRTATVHLKFEAHVNEWRVDDKGRQPILLSHCFKQWTDQDPDHFVSRFTEGFATFNLAELIKRGTVPDQYRAEIYPFIPQNMKRWNIKTEPMDDGLTIHYLVEDKEVAFNTPQAFECTRVEAYEMRNLAEAYAPIGMALQLARAGGNAAANLGGRGWAGLGGRAGIVGGAIDLAVNVGSTIISNLPTHTHKVSVTAWGNRDSSRLFNLQFLATNIAMSRVEWFPDRASSIGTIHHDITGKNVTVELTNTYVPAANVAGVGAARLPTGHIDGGRANALLGRDRISGRFWLGDFRDDGVFGDDTANLLTRQQALNFIPPGSDGCRGTWLAQLMSNILSNPNSIPQDPVNNVNPLVSVVDQELQP